MLDLKNKTNFLINNFEYQSFNLQQPFGYDCDIYFSPLFSWMLTSISLLVNRLSKLVAWRLQLAA